MRTIAGLSFWVSGLTFGLYVGSCLPPHHDWSGFLAPAVLLFIIGCIVHGGLED